MDTLPETTALANLPTGELAATLEDFLGPVLAKLLEERLRRTAALAVEAILGSHSPVITQMTRVVGREEAAVWPLAQRFYRFYANPRFSHHDLLQGLYAHT
jgi:hypothetical protein